MGVSQSDRGDQIYNEAYDLNSNHHLPDNFLSKEEHQILLSIQEPSSTYYDSRPKSHSRKHITFLITRQPSCILGMTTIYSGLTGDLIKNKRIGQYVSKLLHCRASHF